MDAYTGGNHDAIDENKLLKISHAFLALCHRSFPICTYTYEVSKLYKQKRCGVQKDTVAQPHPVAQLQVSLLELCLY